MKLPSIKLSSLEVFDLLNTISEFEIMCNDLMSYTDILTIEKGEKVWKKLRTKYDNMFAKGSRSTKITFDRIDALTLSYIIMRTPKTLGGQKVLTEFGRYLNLKSLEKNGSKHQMEPVGAGCWWICQCQYQTE